MYFTVYPLSSNGKTSCVCATELIFLLCEYDANIIARVMLINIASVERKCSGQAFSEWLAYCRSQSEPVN